MAILGITSTQPAGLTSVVPSVIYINTSDTYAVVTTTGYLTQASHEGNSFSDQQMALVQTTDDGPVWLQVVVTFSGSTVLNTVVSLQEITAPGDVVLPTIANHLIVSTNTTGTLANRTGLAINNGSLQAGLSGTAGSLISFPSTGLKGSLAITAVANTGNTVTTISNAAMGQASAISIPDPGASTANFLLSAIASGPQTMSGGLTISTGNFAVSAGTITASGNITSSTGAIAASQGNISAGSSGHAGTISSFPATASNGALILAGVNAGGAFNTTISNGTMGQSTVYTMGDIGASTGGLVVATSAIRMKSVAQAAVAGGAAAQTVTDTFCTTGSMVTASWNDTSNAVTIQTVAAGNGSFIVTSSGDPGASHLNYIITK